MDEALTDRPTVRQMEVLVAYLQTGTAPAAAAKLGIKERTVRSHLEILRRKLGANTSNDLMSRAIHHGLVGFEVV